MALFSCPECGKQISDKAVCCPHCGFPIQGYMADHVNKNSSVNIIFKSAFGNKLNAIKAVRAILNKSLSEAHDIVESAPCVLLSNAEYSEAVKIKSALEDAGAEIALEPYVAGQEVNLKRYESNEIHCPHCGSTAITTGTRGYSLFTGFLGSNKTVNRCGKCGYSWEP